MNYKIVVSPIAKQNIEDAVDYYVKQVSTKVALEFLKDYRKTYKALQKNPFYQFHDTNYRFIPFKKFKYIAFFIVDEKNKTVFINAIFNTYQDPEKQPRI
ncbi:plasmid stabilization protein [Flavobacterium faecale]|uniref:Plasmid stabilization protein n=1 Tax=Flavobacterium faecale TaxID=1355330 RepID=A0A2S1LEG8_9FLAO|nr:type II toxin-antitoxin system RelE/ParE family toxin [Flavobacterium faecale]AWG21936.1 plasmid stabilization protein [Flavobacterium faecale]